jgi:hypothetical protein
MEVVEELEDPRFAPIFQRFEELGVWGEEE